ncbi:ATP-binding protein [Paracoccus sp. PAR01]|uniref:hybrid sensor histidine kinase/response regulator n=1 Tax=Paracoccus sp. PAR01 TaxID=2769282 RepID=UPI00178451D0|nr:ATP-binding protein [Paracoccus sp. PAR01]MBD9527021.1 response regulator [Paracoccus sp. PAR01]
MITAFQATRERRLYSRWVANETIEDFALRFTARRARRWTAGRVANAALGSISFLALEAIGAAITLNWGFDIALMAILWGGLILFVTGLPISYYAARYGVDIDLLTRGAGFGYFGSTITSLIYASFTFIFFALEAAILGMALNLLFGIPLSIGYLIAAVAVIPLVVNGFSKISAFQALTQPLWIALHVLPFLLLAFAGYDLSGWTTYEGRALANVTGPQVTPLMAFGAASGVVLALIAQIGEQVDYLRFLPEPKTARERRRWWIALVAAGPGWVVLGTIKMLAGSWLVTLAQREGLDFSHAIDPTALYHNAYSQVIPWPGLALLLTGVFVILSQLKINVTNAYAGSIAWSNFFSRITHAHPGRVVWLFFNVAIALLLMELGVFAALEATLSVYAHVALAWIGALFADLTINKPLGLSPKGVEFRRAHLYDINPVGLGAVAGGTLAALLAHAGVFGATTGALSPFVALLGAILIAPLIAWATGGRYYLARPAPDMPQGLISCCLCDYRFDHEDMTDCPFYAAPICSLCCSLNASCNDICKPHAKLGQMTRKRAQAILPERVDMILRGRLTQFLAGTSIVTGGVAALLWMIRSTANEPRLDPLLAVILASTMVASGMAVWLFLLTREARLAAQRDTERQTERLLREIRAHERTDRALQEAKEKAEAANLAKSRYMAGISHELRTPLNAIYGYAQLLDADPAIPPGRREAVRAIRRSSEHLAGLIEGLLDISKIEAGRLELNRSPVQLPDLLRQITDIFQETAREKRLEFVIERMTALPDWVVVDEKRLRQIVINLLANAFRYTDRGRVTLRIGWRNQVATIEVEDTGIGIAPSDMGRIWKPFERGTNMTRHGSGLGLTITKLLVDILGGEVSVSSSPGKGSLFRLKMYLAQTRDVPALPVPAHTAVLEPYDGRLRLLMIVDDDPTHLALMESYLHPQGFNTVLVGTAEAAMQALEDVTPDLFLIDVDMPGMNGWEFLQWLRGNGHAASPVVVLSGHAREAESGAPEIPLHDAFIAKPCILDDLRARIDGLLKIERRPVGARPVAEEPAAPISARQIGMLRELAELGRIRDLRDRIASLPLPPALSQRLGDALMEVDFERIVDVLDDYARTAPHHAD